MSRIAKLWARKYQRQMLLMLFVLVSVSLLLLNAGTAAAHPLGNFSVNRYSRIEVEQNEIRVVYALDMAEIPTFQMWPEIDQDGDEVVSAAEEEAYLTKQVTAIQENLTLTLNGRALPLTAEAQAIQFPPGQGDLYTMRVDITYVASIPSLSEAADVSYQDSNYADRQGWREVVVPHTEVITLLTSDVPAQDVSNALTSYPDDLLMSPPAAVQASFRFEPVAGAGPVAGGGSVAETAAFSADRFGSDRFADLIAIPEMGPAVLLVALLTAFGLGALHALSPGHGKTIVGAYLVGSRGTAKHAVFLGLTTTITHTAGVFLFGLLVLFASQFVLPEKLYPWLGVLSGLLVVLIGFSMFWDRWHHRRNTDSQEDEGYHTHFGIGHTHTHTATPRNGQVSWRSLLALGISGGLLPCPSALVVLLSAIALQRVALGLVLILVFSVGLASVLTGIGLVLVYAGQLFNRFPATTGRLAYVLPMLSALFITLAGAGITWQAFLQTGIV